MFIEAYLGNSSQIKFQRCQLVLVKTRKVLQFPTQGIAQSVEQILIKHQRRTVTDRQRVGSVWARRQQSFNSSTLIYPTLTCDY